ncbi:MAG: S8 family serine peptidase [Deferribacteres bacterium]|nr:S8 family serine peptidase [candidate division KSB1 bacterium]MCB9510377.1 S8 family serine peptidase [Deferribacteres bacterium]
MKLPVLRILLFFLISTILPAQAQETSKYWIYFKDKGPQALAKKSIADRSAISHLSKRAIERRQKVLGKNNLAQFSDLNLYRPYLSILAQQGVEPIVASRWLNAISAELKRDQVVSLRQAQFVEKIVPVRPLYVPETGLKAEPVFKSDQLDAIQTTIDYGSSLQQNALINITALHDAGINGQGVIVGMLDTGFSTARHTAFSSLEVLGEYDFVKRDSVTENESGDVISQHNHGTETLSIIAGYAPGSLVGPAFKSQFYLAKTEDLLNEVRAEEDNWMAAIEWMEAQGVDVASSSLGYRDFFDNPEENYDYSDLDGQTTVITKAAQMAVSKGVVVVTSAGNEGDVFSFPYIGAPADGKDVIAVGAVTSKGDLARFSSIGPTYDGRTKPDVVAMGVGVSIVSVGTSSGYRTGQGTSYACPMVAGVAAQILSAHPYLTPLQVNEALRQTSDRAFSPDNQYGYGLVDARAAITYWGPAFSNEVDYSLSADGIVLSTRCLVGAAENVQKMELFWRLPGDTSFNVASMTRLDSTLYSSSKIAVPPQSEIEFYFSVEVSDKGRFTYPKDAPGVVLGLPDDRNLPVNFTLEQNYPNPFVASQSATTSIRLSLVESAIVSVTIYNILGQEVVKLMDNAPMASGQNAQIIWNGRSASGQLVAAGIYFYQAEFIRSNGDKAIFRNKMALVR